LLFAYLKKAVDVLKNGDRVLDGSMQIRFMISGKSTPLYANGGRINV
jgi:hypothetical protein